jgi:hypothetical protein
MKGKIKNSKLDIKKPQGPTIKTWTSTGVGTYF